MGAACYGLFRRIRPTLSPQLYCAALMLFIAVPSLTHMGLGGDYRGGWAVWASGIAFVLALPNFKEIPWPVVRRVAHVIATYSYGLYLAHVPIMWFAFQKIPGPRWLQFGLCAVLLIAVPLLLYHALEAPLIRVGARISAMAGKGSSIGYDTAELGGSPAAEHATGRTRLGL